MSTLGPVPALRLEPMRPEDRDPGPQQGHSPARREARQQRHQSEDQESLADMETEEGNHTLDERA